MVILENSNPSTTLAAAPSNIDVHSATVATMLAATGNQYLNPDYLTPLASDVSFFILFLFY